MKTETDLQAAYRIQKWLKQVKEEIELAEIELDSRLARIKDSGVLSDGSLELINKPKLYWEINVNTIKERYPMLIPGIVDKINADAEKEIKKLDEHLPVGLVKTAMEQYGVVDSYGHGDLTGLGTQVPKDQWMVSLAFTSSNREKKVK